MRRLLRGILNQFIQPYFYGYTIERFALNDFRTGIRQKALAFTFEMLINDIGYNGIEDGVA